jgi:hypothetical protein
VDSDYFLRSQTLYPTELRAHCTLFTINSLPQFPIRFQPRVSVYFGDLKDVLRKVILLIREYLTKEPFAFERLALRPDALSSGEEA